MTVDIYTDGACRGNPGPGGWGVLLRSQGKEKTLKGAEKYSTNNKMELTAAIQGLMALKRRCQVNVHTDSQYVRQGMTTWLAQWKRNNWRNSQKKIIKNLELWQELDKLTQHHDVTWYWVKGHSGHPENDLADALANQAIDELLASRD